LLRILSCNSPRNFISCEEPGLWVNGERMENADGVMVNRGNCSRSIYVVRSYTVEGTGEGTTVKMTTTEL
jgi:hypothetical protein